MILRLEIPNIQVSTGLVGRAGITSLPGGAVITTCQHCLHVNHNNGSRAYFREFKLCLHWAILSEIPTGSFPRG